MIVFPARNLLFYMYSHNLAEKTSEHSQPGRKSDYACRDDPLHIIKPIQSQHPIRKDRSGIFFGAMAISSLWLTSSCATALPCKSLCSSEHSSLCQASGSHITNQNDRVLITLDRNHATLPTSKKLTSFENCTLSLLWDIIHTLVLVLAWIGFFVNS